MLHLVLNLVKRLGKVFNPSAYNEKIPNHHSNPRSARHMKYGLETRQWFGSSIRLKRKENHET